jgi:hypothetical protein
LTEKSCSQSQGFLSSTGFKCLQAAANSVKSFTTFSCPHHAGFFVSAGAASQKPTPCFIRLIHTLHRDSHVIDSVIRRLALHNGLKPVIYAVSIERLKGWTGVFCRDRRKGSFFPFMMEI